MKIIENENFNEKKRKLNKIKWLWYRRERGWIVENIFHNSFSFRMENFLFMFVQFLVLLIFMFYGVSAVEGRERMKNYWKSIWWELIILWIKNRGRGLLSTCKCFILQHQYVNLFIHILTHAVHFSHFIVCVMI